MKPQVPTTTNMTPLGTSDGHGTSAIMLWKSTPPKLYSAGVMPKKSLQSLSIGRFPPQE